MRVKSAFTSSAHSELLYGNSDLYANSELYANSIIHASLELFANSELSPTVSKFVGKFGSNATF